MELVYDIDAWVTESIQRFGRWIFAVTNIPPMIQEHYFFIISLLASIVHFIYSTATAFTQLPTVSDQSDAPSTAEIVNLFLTMSLTFVLVLCVFYGELLLRSIHSRLDPQNALKVDKDYGDGYRAWTSIIMAILVLVCLLLQSWSGLIVLSIFISNIYSAFIRRQRRRPRRRRVRRKVVSMVPVLERARRQPVPQM